MSRSIRLLQATVTAAAASILLNGAVPAAADPHSNDLPSRVSRALVQVDADACPVGPRRSQGFLIANDRILTVLHGIAGCQSISVSFFDGRDEESIVRVAGAKVVKALAAADLAQLELDRPTTGIEPLIAAGKPNPNAVAFTVARWPGTTGVRYQEMRIGNGSARLRAIVNDKARRELVASASPSIDLEIVKLARGVIVVGTAGAPIVNDKGVVVAIADGGLDDGFAGINWAVSASEVARLQLSTEQLPGQREGYLAAAHFSSRPDASAGVVVTCNGYPFALIGRRRFNDLLEASDDPAGLKRIAAENVTRTATAAFDVYVNVGSGAAVAVPADALLQPYGNRCVAMFGSRRRVMMDLRIYPTTGTPSPTMDRATTRYETDVLTPPLGWGAVPGFTSEKTLSQYDGLIVRRRYLRRFDAGVGNVGDSFFETVAARDDLLVAFCVIYRSPVIVSHRMAALCSANRSRPGCDQFIDDYEEWGEAAIAVHATTFSRTNLTSERSGVR